MTPREATEWAARVLAEMDVSGYKRITVNRCIDEIRRRAAELDTVPQVAKSDAPKLVEQTTKPAVSVPYAMPEEPSVRWRDHNGENWVPESAHRKLRSYATAQRERAEKAEAGENNVRQTNRELRSGVDKVDKYTDTLRALLREARDHLHHTRCIDDDALQCPACSLEARIEKELEADHAAE